MILNNQNAKDLNVAYDLWNDAVEAWGTWTETPESESDEDIDNICFTILLNT